MAVDVIIDPSSGQIYWNDAAGSGTQTIAISGNATNAINIVGYSNFFSPGGGGLGTQILATFNDSATSTFVPGTNSYDLGSSALRWNFYGTGGNFTGVISTSSSTASTSTTTGALTVAGGLGVVGDVYIASASNSRLNIMQSTGDEGGEIFLNKAVTNTTLTTGVTIDVFQNKVRIFETGGSNRGYYLDISAGGNSVGTNLVSAGASGLASLNGLTASSQTFATGTSGSDFNISSSTSTHTFNIPYAGSGATGLVTTQTQTIAGSKTFSSQTIISDTTASTTTATGAMLIFGGLGVSGQINSVSLVTSGNAVINGNLQFKGTGTFGDATTDTITSLARYASDLLPSADNSYDLGNNSLGWRNFRVSGVGTIVSLNVSSSTASTSTTTGALTITGGVGIGGTINAGTRNLSYSAANLLAGFATSVNSYAQIVLQNASTGNAASSDFIVNNDQSTDSAYYGSMGMNSSTFTGAGSLSAPNAVYLTSTTGDLVLGSTTANILRFVYNSGSSDSMQITGTAVSILYTTASSSTTTGALTVGGGVGIGGSLWTSATNFSSISGIGFSNSVITSGVWAGTAISAVNGGTGQVSYTIGDILYASSTTALSKLAAGTAGSVLKSNGAGTAPSWQADATGSGGAGTVATPTASNLVAYYPGTGASVTSNSRVSIDTANSSVEISSQSSKSGLILNAVNGSISNLAELKNSFGDVLWSVGATAQTLRGFGSSLWLDSASTLLLTAPAALSFYNTAETFATSLTGATNASSNLTFILPTAAGTAGSVLTTEGSSGQLYWSSPGASGGSGTVTSGTAGSVAYYTGTGTTVGGAKGFTYTTSGTASTLNVFGGGGAIGTTIFTVQAYSATSVRVGIGTNLPQYELEIVGEISATNKSFVIDHPTKPGKKLRYGSLEGPENGVYVRGELKDSNIIETPDHWVGLVYPDSFTVTLTPIGRFSHLYVEKIEDYKVIIADSYMNPIHCYYTIWAERKDIPKLITEY